MWLIDKLIAEMTMTFDLKLINIGKDVWSCPTYLEAFVVEMFGQKR